MVVRHGRARSTHRRHHAGDARGLRAWSNSRSAFPIATSTSRIAEQHAVTFAAGLACEGARPVVAIYSTFLQRGLRSVHPRRRAAEAARGLRARSRRSRRRRRRHAPGQLRPHLHALHPQPGDHGARGRERMPADALHRHARWIGPAAVRYPRGHGPGVAVESDVTGAAGGPRAAAARWSAAVSRCSPSARWSAPAERIAERLDATLVNMRFVKPLDEALMHRYRGTPSAIVTLEENTIAGGAGSAVAELLAAARRPAAVAAARPAGPLRGTRLARGLSEDGRARRCCRWKPRSSDSGASPALRAPHRRPPEGISPTFPRSEPPAGACV